MRYPQYSNDYFPNIKRAEEASRLTEMAFREFRTFALFNTNQVIGQANVQEGTEAIVPVTAAKPVAVTMQVDSRSGLKSVVTTDPSLVAPIAQGQRVGTVTITAPDFPTQTLPVYAAQGGAARGHRGVAAVGPYVRP